MEGPQRIQLLRRELDRIKNPNIQSLVATCLIEAPDYIFEDCSSSSTGKYHPPDELGPDGTIIHIKKMVRLVESMCRGLSLEHKTDELIAAAIIHDLMKRGDGGGHTVEEHPELAAKFLDAIYRRDYRRGRNKIDYKVYRNIRNCILYHYGPWTVPKYNKDMSKYTLSELCLYLCDYISSRRFVRVEIETL